MEAVDRIPRSGGRAPATRRVDALWLGRIGYERALVLQREAAARVAAAGAETLLLLEHDPVFTLGRNASEADVLFTPAKRRELGVDLFEADRGGKVTYHGPGQLVGYPILNLDPDRRDVRRYVRDLEEVLIGTLADFGVSSVRSTLPARVSSVWIGNDKIAAIGVHISRWITTHGFALNVTEEPLPWFRGIVPCGITDGGVTSLERVLGRPVAVRDVIPKLCARFASAFARDVSVAGP
ncbi:MAG TPA: lipoyl(octanoyl) transferase LipB [Thermoanaerobaculia bacterium]